jgi:LPXTG-motif cell wall-anchored protein
VPSVCRRIVVLLVVALLGVGAGVGGPVQDVFAQGAGDQQYQDPFGDSGTSTSGGSGGSNSGGSGGSNSGSGTIDPITPAPQTSGGSAGSGSSSGSAATSQSATTTSPSSPAATGQLPNTGLDARVLVLAGVVLVLAGVGLRLRNAPERF